MPLSFLGLFSNIRFNLEFIAAVAAGTIILIQHFEIEHLQTKADERQATVTAYEIAAQTLAAEANRTTERIVERIKYVKVQSEPKIIYIDKFTKDANETDFSASMRLYSGYLF